MNTRLRRTLKIVGIVLAIPVLLFIFAAIGSGLSEALPDKTPKPSKSSVVPSKTSVPSSPVSPSPSVVVTDRGPKTIRV